MYKRNTNLELKAPYFPTKYCATQNTNAIYSNDDQYYKQQLLLKHFKIYYNKLSTLKPALYLHRKTCIKFYNTNYNKLNYGTSVENLDITRTSLNAQNRTSSITSTNHK